MATWLLYCELKFSWAYYSYLFNPYVVLSCLARSTSGLENAVLLLAVCGRATGELTLKDLTEGEATFCYVVYAFRSLHTVQSIPL